MMRFIGRPEDIERICKRCDTSVEELSELTGVSVQEHLAYSRGDIPLSACDRLGTFLVLYREFCADICLREKGDPKEASTLSKRMWSMALQQLHHEVDEELAHEAAEKKALRAERKKPRSALTDRKSVV